MLWVLIVIRKRDSGKRIGFEERDMRIVSIRDFECRI